MVDDWGWGNVGWHRPGFNETITPNLDSLVASGVQLTSQYVHKYVSLMPAPRASTRNQGPYLHIHPLSLHQPPNAPVLANVSTFPPAKRPRPLDAQKLISHVTSPTQTKIPLLSRSSLQSGRLPIHVNVLNADMSSWNPRDPVSGFAGMPRNMTGISAVMNAVRPLHAGP